MSNYKALIIGSIPLMKSFVGVQGAVFQKSPLPAGGSRLEEALKEFTGE
ncbi:MAG: hypothetical protein KAW12_00530 [Candidatus Aminicenantes bacterium]|nr:hypothetical protein [Candidatus Aminicenantes bacterium]